MDTVFTSGAPRRFSFTCGCVGRAGCPGVCACSVPATPIMVMVIRIRFLTCIMTLLSKVSVNLARCSSCLSRAHACALIYDLLPATMSADRSRGVPARGLTLRCDQYPGGPIDGNIPGPLVTVTPAVVVQRLHGLKRHEHQ